MANRPARVVIEGSGAEHIVELTDDEIASLDAARQATAAVVAQREAQRQAVTDAGPANAIVAKIRSGASLTAGELAQVVRWLALRAVGPEAP